jgi:hypothetical protein
LLVPHVYVNIGSQINVELAMPNITIHLDDETHRLAKIYAAQSGLSLSKSFRDHIRAISGHGETRDAKRRNVEAIELAVIKRYARMELTASEAMAALNFACIEELFSATVQAGLQLPRLSKTAALQLTKPLTARRKAAAHA